MSLRPGNHLRALGSMASKLFDNQVQGDCTIPADAILLRVLKRWDRDHAPPAGAWACESAAGDVLQVVEIDQTPGSRKVFVLEHRPVIPGRCAARPLCVWYEIDSLTGAAHRLARVLMAERDEVHHEKGWTR